MNQWKSTAAMVWLGRPLFVLATFALLGSMGDPATGESILGMSQQHLFNHAIVLSLFGIGMFPDAHK